MPHGIRRGGDKCRIASVDIRHYPQDIYNSRTMTLRFLPPLAERRTASDEVADTLRGAIINGQFDDGQELNQVELARHFGVSRVPVREALRRLQAEGLVTAEAH